MGHGVAVEEVCPEVILVEVVFGIDLALTHRRLVGEEAGLAVVPGTRVVVVVESPFAVVGDVPVAVGIC